MSKPPRVYVKARHDEDIIRKAKRSASAKRARAALRTPTRGVQRDKDKAEIAEFLARVPPRYY